MENGPDMYLWTVKQWKELDIHWKYSRLHWEYLRRGPFLPLGGKAFLLYVILKCLFSTDKKNGDNVVAGTDEYTSVQVYCLE